MFRVVPDIIIFDFIIFSVSESRLFQSRILREVDFLLGSALGLSLTAPEVHLAIPACLLAFPHLREPVRVIVRGVQHVLNERV